MQTLTISANVCPQRLKFTAESKQLFFAQCESAKMYSQAISLGEINWVQNSSILAELEDFHEISRALFLGWTPYRYYRSTLARSTVWALRS
jgi:hypothetical protein